MILNLGSGDHPAPLPWVNVDSQPDTNPDLVADARQLRVRTGSVRAVYCGHLLEHLTLETGLPAALAEIRRFLQPHGRACFVGPDYERALTFNDDVLLQVIRTGGCRWEGDRHEWLSTAATALTVVRKVFPDAIEVPIQVLDAFWPVVSRVGWQFAITATKEVVSGSW